MHELQTVYGVKDLYDLLEIIAVDANNQREIAEWRERKARTQQLMGI